MHPHLEFAHVVFCACVQQRRQVPLRELYLNVPLRLPFASFACVRAVMRNRKSAKEKMWWKQGRAPACGEEARHHTFLHCACVCGGFYSPARTWLYSVFLKLIYCSRSAYSYPCARSTADPSVEEDEHVHNLQQVLKERKKDRIRKREREGEHKYAGAQHACASEIEMNRKSAKERGQDVKSERASFSCVCVWAYTRMQMRTFSNTHTHVILHAVSCPDSHFFLHIKKQFCIIQITNHYFLYKVIHVTFCVY